MSARKSSHRTIFLIVSNGSPLALIASSLRSTSKKPVCPMTRSLHPPMAHCRQRVRFAATWREKFFEVPQSLYLYFPLILARALNGQDGQDGQPDWTARVAPTAIDRSIAQGRPAPSQRQSLRSTALAASDKPAPKRSARRPAARQRPRPDAENFGGEVSF